jgi:uncharacterized protein (TIGR02996 family)
MRRPEEETMSLESALCALPDHPEAALRDLCLVWEERRSPEVAALVDRLDARLSEGRPPLAPPPEIAEDKAWGAVARKRDPIDVGRLSAAPMHPNSAWETERFQTLVKHHGNDPRILGGLLRDIATKPGIHFWWNVGRLLKRLADPRLVTALEQAVASWPKKPAKGERAEDLAAMKEELVQLIEQLRRAMDKREPLSAEEKVALKKLQAAIGSVRVAAVAPGKPAKAQPERQPAPKGGSLAAALRSVGSKPEAALVALLDAWRASRTPALAELIELVGARIERAALPQKPAATAHAEWLICERAGDPADLARLVATLRVGTVVQMVERLGLLAARPEDPRIARAALAILEDQPFSSQSTRKLYGAAVEALAAMRDPRTLERLEHIKAHRMPGLGAEGGTDFRDFFAAKLERALKVARSVPPPTDLEGDDRAAMEAAAAKLGAGASDADTEARLLEAIWSAPAEDVARQVYADWLQERGRPHGELIALQLADAAGSLSAEGKKRMWELLARHAREFLGPIGAAIQLGNIKFERGFVVHAELSDKRSPLIKDISEHPAWATLKTAWVWTTARTLYPELVAHLKKLGVKFIQRDQLQKYYPR